VPFDISNLELPPGKYVYGEPVGWDGQRVPVWYGDPTPDQANLRNIDACHVVVAMRAAARTRPGAIRDTIEENGDGTIVARLHEASFSKDRLSTAATGRIIELRMTTRLPAGRDDPGRPVFTDVRHTEAAWSGLLMKGLAGVDRSWTNERIAVHASLFNQRPEAAAARGFARLNFGGSAAMAAEVLTQVTGERARVFQWRTGAEAAATWRKLLGAARPAITATFDAPDALGFYRRYGLATGHGYEIVGVADGPTGIGDGTVMLSNPAGRLHPWPIPVSELGKVLMPWFVTLYTPRAERSPR